MTISLNQISKSLFEKSSKISEIDSAKLSEVIACGITFVELLQYLVDHSSKENISILKNVLDEIFIDLHVSVTLAMGSQYKAACVLLRACIEISLYALYFVDHPLEARIWANAPHASNIQDMSFSHTLEEITSIFYAEAASGRQPDTIQLSNAKDQLQKAYRLLSERVHGKYIFLQSTSTDIDSLLRSFADLALNSIRSLINLGTILSKNPSDIKTTIPAMEKYL